MAMQKVPEGAQEFNADWTGADRMPTQFVNQILVQLGLPLNDAPDGVYLTFGSVSPPVIYGSPEMMEAQAKSYGGKLPIEPVARILISRQKTVELVKLLQDAVKNYDTAAEAVGREKAKSAKKEEPRV